jgi:hypothetical protein
MFRTWSFTAGEDNNLEHPTQEQEEWRTTTIGFEFYRSFKNSTITFQAVVGQPATTNPIDSTTQIPIRTPSTTTRSCYARRISLIRRSNRESVNSSSKYPTVNSTNRYPTINMSMTIKCGFSSSSHTPPQPGLQHGPIVGPNLWDKSGLMLQNRCVLSDYQATHHHLTSNISRLTQQGMTSLNGAT